MSCPELRPKEGPRGWRWVVVWTPDAALRMHRLQPGVSTVMRVGVPEASAPRRTPGLAQGCNLSSAQRRCSGNACGNGSGTHCARVGH